MPTMQKTKTVHILRATFKRGVYREIAIQSSKTLEALAQAIVEAFDFDFDHAYGFYNDLKDPYRASMAYELFYDLNPKGGLHDRETKGVQKTKIAEVFTESNPAMGFLFDYGDDWFFKVKLKTIQSAEDAPKRLPAILLSKGEAPEQYPDDDEDEM